jgi:hypothetical protein
MLDFRGYYASNRGEAQVKVKVAVENSSLQPQMTQIPQMGQPRRRGQVEVELQVESLVFKREGKLAIGRYRSNSSLPNRLGSLPKGAWNTAVRSNRA